MKRLHQTSRGPIEVDLDRGAIEGTAVTVTLFDADGWETESKRWSSKYGHQTRDETLPAFLARFAGLPQTEAESLADELVGRRLNEWSNRGGPQHVRTIERLTLVTVAALAFCGLLAVIGVFAIVRYLIT